MSATCPNCGAEVSSDDRHCDQCWHALYDEEETASTSNAHQSAQETRDDAADESNTAATSSEETDTSPSEPSAQEDATDALSPVTLISHTIQYLLGFGYLFLSLGSFPASIVTGLLLLIGGLLIMPATRSRIEETIGYNLNGLLTGLVVVALFVAGMLLYPTGEEQAALLLLLR